MFASGSIRQQENETRVIEKFIYLKLIIDIQPNHASTEIN